MGSLEDFIKEPEKIKKGDNMVVDKTKQVEKKKAQKNNKKSTNSEFLKDGLYYVVVTLAVDKSPVNLNDSSGNISLNKRVPVFSRGRAVEYPGMSQNAVKNSIIRAFVKENPDLINDEEKHNSIPELIKRLSDGKKLKTPIEDIVRKYPTIDLNGYLFTVSPPVSKDSTFNTSVLAPRIFMDKGIPTVYVKQYSDIHISLSNDNPTPFYIEEVSGYYQFYMTIRADLIGMIPPVNSSDDIKYIDSEERYRRFRGLLKTLISKWLIDEFGKSKTTVRVLQVAISNIPLLDMPHDPAELLYSRLIHDNGNTKISALIFLTDEFTNFINEKFKSLDYFRKISEENSSIKTYENLINEIEQISKDKNNYNILIRNLTYTEQDIKLLDKWLENERLKEH